MFLRMVKKRSRKFPRALVGCAALVTASLLAGPAEALTVKGSAVLEPDDDGDPVSSTVTFKLPHHVWISGLVFVIPDPNLVGEHTCEIRADQTADHSNLGLIEPGNVKIYARLQRGRKPGTVFVGTATRRADLSLFNAGCDGIPGNDDVFEGHVAALYAAPAVYLAQALSSTSGDPEGRSLRQEIYDTFDIDLGRSEIEPKLLEFHSFEAGLNPGGSAIGFASAQISLKFRPPSR